MAVRLSALRAGRPLSPGRCLVLISVRGRIDSRVILLLEWLGQLKIFNRLIIGTRSRDLPACSIVPQPTTLTHTPNFTFYAASYPLHQTTFHCKSKLRVRNRYVSKKHSQICSGVGIEIRILGANLNTLTMVSLTGGQSLWLFGLGALIDDENMFLELASDILLRICKMSWDNTGLGSTAKFELVMLNLTVQYYVT
jgi:hypothetical protein